MRSRIGRSRGYSVVLTGALMILLDTPSKRKGRPLPIFSAGKNRSAADVRLELLSARAAIRNCSHGVTVPRRLVPTYHRSTTHKNPGGTSHSCNRGSCIGCCLTAACHPIRASHLYPCNARSTISWALAMEMPWTCSSANWCPSDWISISGRSPSGMVCTAVFRLSVDSS